MYLTAIFFETLSIGVPYSSLQKRWYENNKNQISL